MDLVSLLQQSRLFSDMPRAVLEERLIPRGRTQEYQKDQFLILPRQQVDKIGLVLSGRVHILHLFENGGQSLMNAIPSGEFIAADLAFTHSRLAPYHAMAAAPTRVFWLPAELLSEHGPLDEKLRLTCLEGMLTLISQENMRKEYRLAILSRNGLRDRITAYLSMQAGRRNSASFAIPFSREEMAAFLCVNRSALSHELSRMQKEGLITFRKNRFTLHIRDAE